MASLVDNFRRILARRFFLRSQSVECSIGVDLGSAFTKFVILQRKGPKAMLRNWGMEPILQHFEKEQVTHGQSAFPLKSLHVCWENKEIHKSSLGVSVSGPRVMIKRLEFPTMGEEDIREHLKWELDRYISPEMGEVLWDVHLSSSVPSNISNKTDALLVVGQKPWIESITSDFHQYHRKISFVDVDAFALANMVMVNYDAEEMRLLVHLGPNGMLLVLLWKGEVWSVREVPFSVEWYGDLVEQMRNVQRQYPDEYPSASVQILWEPFLDEISEQIRDAISEYSSFMNFSSLIAVVLSGGYAAVGGMDEKLSQKLRVPVRLLNPFNRIEVPVHIAQDPSFLSALPLLGVAVGVALRGGREA